MRTIIITAFRLGVPSKTSSSNSTVNGGDIVISPLIFFFGGGCSIQLLLVTWTISNTQKEFTVKIYLFVLKDLTVIFGMFIILSECSIVKLFAVTFQTQNDLRPIYNLPLKREARLFFIFLDVLAYK